MLLELGKGERERSSVAEYRVEGDREREREKIRSVLQFYGNSKFNLAAETSYRGGYIRKKVGVGVVVAAVRRD